jgi:hypothetical protein
MTTIYCGATVDHEGEKIFVGQEGIWPIERYRSMNWLVRGAKVRLHDGEIQVDAVLEFDESTKNWYGRPIWPTQRELSSKADGLEDYRHADPGLRLAILRVEAEFCLKTIGGSMELLRQLDLGVVQSLPDYFNERMIRNLLVAVDDLKEIVDVLTNPD